MVVAEMENELVSKLPRKQTLPFLRYLSEVATSCVNKELFGEKNAWIETLCLLQRTKEGPQVTL